MEQRHDIEITWRPYDLHPEIRAGGIDNTRRFSRIAQLAAEEGLPFNPPRRIRPTRLAHQAAMYVEAEDPSSARRYHDRLFGAVWDQELDIEDPRILIELASDTGADPTGLAEVLETGALEQGIVDSTSEAWEWGISGTPSWVFDSRLMLPGVQDDDVFDRMITRMFELRDKEGHRDR